MKHAQLIKKVVALTLAALIGLSALSGIIMAFAVPEEDKVESMPEPITQSPVYLLQEDELEVTVLDKSLQTVTLQFEEAATFTVAPGNTRQMWLGWDDQYSNPIENLSDAYHVNFDVLNFVFVTKFAEKGTMTMTTKNPYLYTLQKGILTPVETTFKDGVHTFSTDTLDCFLASDGMINQ